MLDRGCPEWNPRSFDAFDPDREPEDDHDHRDDLDDSKHDPEQRLASQPGCAPRAKSQETIRDRHDGQEWHGDQREEPDDSITSPGPRSPSPPVNEELMPSMSSVERSPTTSAAAPARSERRARYDGVLYGRTPVGLGIGGSGGEPGLGAAPFASFAPRSDSWSLITSPDHHHDQHARVLRKQARAVGPATPVT